MQALDNSLPGAGDGRQAAAGIAPVLPGQGLARMNQHPKSGHPLRHLQRPVQPPGMALASSPGGLEGARGFSQAPPSPPVTPLPQPGHPARGGPSPNVTAGGFNNPRGASSTAPSARGAEPPAVPEDGRPQRGSRGSLGARRAHMMVQRFLRRAPWKRMVVWTCLQRAQPTLLRSSLKSSRMCQLYLAEHSM